MRDKHRRAWEPFRPYEVYSIAVIPVVAAGVVLWLGTRDEADAMTTVVYPTIAFGVTAFVLVVGFHLGPYAYRLVTGKTAIGRGRTLEGLRRTKLMDALRDHNPSGVHNLRSYSSSKEVEDFAREIGALFEKAGWQIDYGLGRRWDSEDGPTPRDVSIRLPAGDNPGLRALGQFLNRYGYVCTFLPPNTDGSFTAYIRIGEATH